MTLRVHGGPDALGHPRFDFSSNSNACGPCPIALQAVQQADASTYPDPSYKQLRCRLAQFHGVEADRLILGTSGSELIQRLTAWRAKAGDIRFWTPPQAYGDYAHAASVWHLTRVASVREAQLVWLCEPSSPLGQGESPEVAAQLLGGELQTIVIDRAYAPLRLSGVDVWSAQQLEHVWQLWSPNKALGLTGIRAAYAIAPLSALRSTDMPTLEAMSGSWPIGAHGVAMLSAWTQPNTQDWIAQSRQTLLDWTNALRQLLQHYGWVCLPSQTNFFCAMPPTPNLTKISAHSLANILRDQGIKLRDASSLGLAGWWRLSAQPAAALVALEGALKHINRGATP